MKIKFKLLTTILIASQLVFFIVLAGCGEKGGHPKCNIVDVDVSGHAIQISEFFDQSEAFQKKITYNDTEIESEASFLTPQLDTLNSNAITDLLNRYASSIDYKSGIIGLRVFFTLDIIDKKIKLYYTPDNTEGVDDLGKGVYGFVFGNRYDNVLDCIQKRVSIYEAVNGTLVDISDDQNKLTLARLNWNNYKSQIIFDKRGPFGADRQFDINDDATSVFFPQEEFEAIRLANSSSNKLYVASGLKPFSSTYRHTINFGTIHPPVDSSNKELTEEEIRAFVGMAGNLGQLCPSKCKGIKANRIPENSCTFKIIKD